MRRKTIALSLVVAFGFVAILTLSGCSPTGPQWVDVNTSYTANNVSDVYGKADISKFAQVSAADTTQQRHDALTGLRKRGGTAASAADLITKTLPSDTRGIPVYVERASYDGQPALVLVEAIGPAQGKLTTKRLWVLSSTGAVLFVGSR